VTEPIEYLDLDDVLELARAFFGEPPPIRDVGLLGSAVARPQTTVFGADAYPDLWTKAAALLHSIVKNHALVDGNKRLGWLATAVFLDLNGVRVTSASNDDVFDLVMDIAANNRSMDDIAQRLRRLVRRSGKGPSGAIPDRASARRGTTSKLGRPEATELSDRGR
jgi:death-on-curing protein